MYLQTSNVAVSLETLSNDAYFFKFNLQTNEESRESKATCNQLMIENIELPSERLYLL